MVQIKRMLHQRKHPFDDYPFEGLLFGSWKPVKNIKIESRTLSLYFKDNHCLTMEKGPSTDIRLRSRKATSLDCSCFLRPGIDICVLIVPKCGSDSDKSSSQPVWVDAKIKSIQRNPHDSECSCQYYVNLYVNQGSIGTQRTLVKEVEIVGINRISIPQRLDNNARENSPYRWVSTMDCSTIPQTKLLCGKFLSDISWFIVTSVLKKFSFNVRSIDNTIVYQVLAGDKANNGYTLNHFSFINVVNFKVDQDDIVKSFITQVDTSGIKKIGNTNDFISPEGEAPPSCNIQGLRRSMRHHVEPERYQGCDASNFKDVCSIRAWPYKVRAGKDIVVDDDDESVPLASECGFQAEKCLREDVVKNNRKRWNSSKGIVIQPRLESKNHTPLSTINPCKGDPFLHMDCSLNNKGDENEIGNVDDDEEDVGEFSSRDYHIYGASRKRKENSSSVDNVDIESIWEGRNLKNGVEGKRYQSTLSRSRNEDDKERAYKDRTINSTAYKEMIDSYLKNNKIPNKEELNIRNQCNETSNCKLENGEGTSPKKEDAEMSEIDKLWNEMDSSLISIYLQEDAVPADIGKICDHDNRLDEEIGIYCLRCGVVSVDITSITPDFLPRVRRRHQEEEEQEEMKEEEETKKLGKAQDPTNQAICQDSAIEPISQENAKIWELIPGLREKMHVHQRRAFEFLWQNIVGSTKPSQMEVESKDSGGCVISHCPGAGKTFLIIAFLTSFLKLFPGKRPLVLAPKTTLYTWHKEFIKWKIPIPVYLIHGSESHRELKKTSLSIPGVPKPTNDVNHTLDCLEKIQKWRDHPSVLIMGYTSFLAMVRGNSKYEHKKYIAKEMRESPGLLILDEGHNPRSTKSKLRKVLMTVETEHRVLLSGTLFQNNFCEYFNTLCLARPKFIQEVLKELDIKYEKHKVAEKAPHLVEALARKFFLDKIGKIINSKDDESFVSEESIQSINLLKKLTSGFIDVYEGGNHDTLPGLKVYTLLINMTKVQQRILNKLHKKMANYSCYPLEIELLITLGSIHPYLITKATCASKFFSHKQLMELDNYKYDLRIGTKVRFVMSLVHRVFKEEKVLIFCHNIAPMMMLLEQFEKCFKWKKDKEVLVITGELELFDRGRVIDKFEDPCGESKVLLASITACAEGISLTAASRVIMLDTEWNPSKTKQAIARAFRPGQQKIVYVYQLIATESIEEDKNKSNTWKEWVSNMIFNEEVVEPSQSQAQNIEDEVLRVMVEEDKSKVFHKIMTMNMEKPTDDSP